MGARLLLRLVPEPMYVHMTPRHLDHARLVPELELARSLGTRVLPRPYRGGLVLHTRYSPHRVRWGTRSQREIPQVVHHVMLDVGVSEEFRLSEHTFAGDA